MDSISTATGGTLSYEKHGSGPPLLLVHGSFSDHESNWEFVKPLFEPRFTVYAIARRGRGESTAPEGHALDAEGADVATLIEAIGEPLFLLGHSYGAQVALSAAAQASPGRVRKLVLYEPPWPDTTEAPLMARLADLAAQGGWDELAYTFFRDGLAVPGEELDGLRASELWPPIVADAEATWADLRALAAHPFDPERFRGLAMPVLLQIGSESPRELYATDALAAVLPDARVEPLPGQAHEGMTTAPALYAEAVTRFLLG